MTNQLLDPPGVLSDEDIEQATRILFNAITMLDSLSNAQKEQLEEFIASQWGLVVFRFDEMSKMLPDLQAILDAYSDLDRLKG